MVTIREVAQRAGVSTATVSRVVNGSSHVTPETRDKILQIIQDLNYVPDGLARGTAMQQSRIIGMIVPDIRNGSFAEIYLGASDVASRHGYVMWLVDSNDNPKHEREMWLQLRRVRVDGVLVTPVDSRVNSEVWKTSPVPLCFVDRNVDSLLCDFVGIDNFHGVYEATKFLLNNRHTHLGIIAGPQSNSAGRDRLAGFMAAMHEAACNVHRDDVAIGDFHEKSGYLLGRRMLAKDPPPSGIVVCNNLMTSGLLQAIADTASVRLGETVAVIGFDDFPLATAMDPALSVVSRPMREVGAKAAELLILRLSQPNRAISQVILGPHMILRGSERFPSKRHV